MANSTLYVHETADLSELIMSCTNSINCMGLFINQAKDPTLKALIQKHMAAHVQDYNMKVEWASKGSCADKLNVPVMPPKTTATNVQTSAVMPNPQTTMLDDRSIATSYLLTLKRSGRDYAWAAMEAADPNLRAFLEDAFTMCSHHALEIWNWMYEHGYYPAGQTTTTHTAMIEQTFKPVQNAAMVH